MCRFGGRTLTIDKYLGQAKRLKSKADKAEEKLKAIESRSINPRSSLNLGDGVPANSRNVNGTETRLLEYIDAGKAYTVASNDYKTFREQLKQTTANMVHWQAQIIEQIYVYNVFFGYDDFDGVGEILRTTDRHRILMKLDESKRSLADLLRAQGVEIED